MEKRRVVVTGLGVISGIGKNTNEFWQSICECHSGIAPLESVDRTKLRFQNGAEVKNYNPQNYFTGKNLEFLDRFAQFGLIAAREAVGNAEIKWTDELRQKTCIVTGTSIGGQDTQENAFVDLYQKNRPRVHPLSIPRIMPNSAASNISMEFGVTGATFTISTACASGNHAIGNAFWMIRGGLNDLALAGGSETPFNFGYLKAWEAIRVVAPDTCRPFSKDREGMILGEGGAMLVLETLESAEKRGAEILAEIVGFGMSADASHITKPEQSGAERAMKLALADAHVSPEQVDYINAHGTGTLANDPMETAAIRGVFGAHADKLAVSSTKSLHGHVLGGTSAVEGIATVLAIKNGILPPTANFIEADPECNLDVVPNAAREKSIGYAMSNAFAFGGLNAVLVFRRWQ
ncbi:MAG: beta-ketoacyl-[acyl-carrier-protein] synthase family protein [Acidobacteriota bacterium]|nr:beta-ketoacyl-[acyl-carrier-protein] synthase family protein [Acidobacteriota bacterium]